MESNAKSENVITLIQHKHPLHLVDLQPCYPDYVEFSDGEEEDKVRKWDFNSPCNQSGKDINVYHSSFHIDQKLSYIKQERINANGYKDWLVISTMLSCHKARAS
nr:B-box-type zinc finger, zinc finger, PHD-type, DC1 [Tanacetum cinerariifolium]